MRHTAFTKYAAIITASCLTLGMMSGCGQSNDNNQTGAYDVTGGAAMQSNTVTGAVEQTQQRTQAALTGQAAETLSAEGSRDNAASGKNVTSAQPAEAAQAAQQSDAVQNQGTSAQNSYAVTLPDTSEARPVVVSGEKTLGDTGRTFVNDYNPSDRSYAASDNYISPKGNRQYGTTTTVEYYSSTLGTMRKADVILPYGYDASKSYPVLYMLHGMGGSNKSWSDMGVKYIVENVHYENGVPDMIIVCVDCFVSTQDQDSVAIRDMSAAYDLTESEIMNDLMPYINSNYSTKTGRNNTAIAGYSLGGRGALAIGFKHQDQFGYIGAFSAASGVIPNGSGRSILATLMDDFVLEYGDFPMILINVGETDGICGDSCRFYDDALTQRGIKHIFYEMEGDHEGTVWQNGLYNFVKRIFV